MERRNFAEVLKNAQVDILKEYDRLFTLCTESKNDKLSFTQYCEARFEILPFKGTCITWKDFIITHNFIFERQPKNFDINYLINYCEFIYNIAIHNKEPNRFVSYSGDRIIRQINEIKDKIGYTKITNEGIIILVPKSQPAIVVAEMLPSPLSYKVIEYNHHSMKGNLARKQATLKLLADQLEPKRDTLKSLNKSLEDDLFYLLNNINIRHNNTDSDSTKYKKPVADMSKEELEKWYDKTYDLCLYAFMTLDQKNRNAEIKELKERLNSNE